MLPPMEGRLTRWPRASFRTRSLWPPLAALAAGLLVVVIAIRVPFGVDLMARLELVAIGIPVIAASALLAAKRPEWSVFALLVLAAFEGTLTAYAGSGIRELVWVALLGLLVASAAAYIAPDRSRVVVWPGIVGLAAYALLSAAQIPFAETGAIGARAFAAGPALLAAFFAFAYAQWGIDQRWRIAQAAVAVMFLAGAYALFRLIVGPSATELTLYRPSADLAGELSLFGSFASRVELSAWSAVAIPWLFSLALAMRGRWRLLAAGGAVLMIVALIGSEVRTSLIGAAGGIVVVTVGFQLSRAFRGRAGAALVATVAIAAAGMVGFALTVGSDSESSDRFARIFTPSRDLSFQQRLEKWDAALKRINEHPLGEGLGTTGTTQRLYSRTYRLDNRYIDNSYLQLGVQQGYPGWILLGLGLGLTGYMLARSSLMTADPRRAAMGIGAVASLAACLVTLLTGDILTSVGVLLLWALLGLAAGGFVVAAPARSYARRPGAAST
jgi:hypothetical protein